jgi:hypothetical protein
MVDQYVTEGRSLFMSRWGAAADPAWKAGWLVPWQLGGRSPANERLPPLGLHAQLSAS